MEKRPDEEKTKRMQRRRRREGTEKSSGLLLRISWKSRAIFESTPSRLQYEEEEQKKEEGKAE